MNFTSFEKIEHLKYIDRPVDESDIIEEALELLTAFFDHFTEVDTVPLSEGITRTVLLSLPVLQYISKKGSEPHAQKAIIKYLSKVIPFVVETEKGYVLESALLDNQPEDIPIIMNMGCKHAIDGLRQDSDIAFQCCLILYSCCCPKDRNVDTRISAVWRTLRGEPDPRKRVFKMDFVLRYPPGAKMAATEEGIAPLASIWTLPQVQRSRQGGCNHVCSLNVPHSNCG